MTSFSYFILPSCSWRSNFDDVATVGYGVCRRKNVCALSTSITDAIQSRSNLVFLNTHLSPALPSDGGPIECRCHSKVGGGNGKTERRKRELIVVKSIRSRVLLALIVALVVRDEKRPPHRLCQLLDGDVDGELRILAREGERRKKVVLSDKYHHF